MADDYFPDSVQIVDWYHATEYLAHAAEAPYPHDADAAHNWQKARRDDLFLGQTHKLIEPLERAGLTAQAEYFRKHTRRMHLRPRVSLAGLSPWLRDHRKRHQALQAPPVQPRHALVAPSGRTHARPTRRGHTCTHRRCGVSGTYDELWALARN